MKEIKRETVIELLQKECAVVTFTKNDGTERVLNCTLQAEYLPMPVKATAPEPFDGSTVHAPARAVNEHVVAAFDTDINEFRSFRLDSVITITVNGVEQFA
tara:strand:- start:388 stop:690 length:303 start_codon:yes stop_codon:yes gene_type:complete